MCLADFGKSRAGAQFRFGESQGTKKLSREIARLGFNYPRLPLVNSLLCFTQGVCYAPALQTSPKKTTKTLKAHFKLKQTTIFFFTLIRFDNRTGLFKVV